MHEANGDVLRTTDGGATWHAVGSLGAAGSDAKMRFADSSRGFAYNTRGLFGTTDGGAHWKKLQTPFSVVADLEISRGVVYAVTWPPDNATGGFTFRIWSARASDLVWSRDQLTLQVGAGPIPSEQIVFAGGQGWILNEDRTVISGARLPSTGPWVSWKPPCLDVLGPAQLAASSGADLVASCHEHEWGGGPIASAVYFSHDGGQTFQRRAAPAFGEVASPNPTTAVIEENGVLRRTTDEGASWSEVAREPNAYHARDLGFTTATQGFVIFDTGRMLMTYDAGATWSAVTRP